MNLILTLSTPAWSEDPDETIWEQILLETAVKEALEMHGFDIDVLAIQLED